MAKRAKKSGSPKKKGNRKKNKRKTSAAPAAAPKRTNRKRSSGKRRSTKRSSSPKKTGRKRARRSGRKFTKYSKVRAHRRRTHNPSGALVQAGLAAGAGVLATLIVLAATYYASKDVATQSRNKKIAAGVLFAVAALVVAKKRPIIAAGIAAGAALAAFGDYATLKMMQYLPQKSGGTTAGLIPLGAVYQQNMRGMQQMGAVYEENMAGVPTAPWLNPTPFG